MPILFTDKLLSSISIMNKADDDFYTKDSGSTCGIPIKKKVALSKR
jgi:hypothetical protein